MQHLQPLRARLGSARAVLPISVPLRAGLYSAAPATSRVQLMLCQQHSQDVRIWKCAHTETPLGCRHLTSRRSRDLSVYSQHRDLAKQQNQSDTESSGGRWLVQECRISKTFALFRPLNTKVLKLPINGARLILKYPRRHLAIDSPKAAIDPFQRTNLSRYDDRF